MNGKEQIIQLGQLLKEEQRREFDDEAVAGGMASFLATWRSEANAALEHEPVRQALELLDDYATLDQTARRARVGIAIETLRNLFRPPPPIPTPKTPAKPSSAPKVPIKKLALDSPLEDVTGMGKANAQAFRRLGVRTVADLLYHFPHRYDDFSSQKQIGDLKEGMTETVIGVVSDVRTFGTRSGRNGVELLVSDETGDLKAVFFNQPWLVKQLQLGARIVISGKVTIDTYRGGRQMSAPDWEPFTEDGLIHTGRLVPVHPLTKGLIERNVRRLIKQVIDYAAPLVPEYLPDNVRTRAGLLPLVDALRQIHFPDNQEQLQAARTRLGFDEFLFIQIGVLQRKLLWQGERGHPMQFHEQVHEQFLKQLSFDLTGAQVRAVEDLLTDMRRPVPMARLLQGDVGSGKTAVAAAVALQAIANGFQAALMAPTEILAEQHYKGLKKLLSKVQVQRPNADEHVKADNAALAELAEIKRLLGMVPEDDLEGNGVRVALLTGSLGARDKRRALEAIEHGDVDLVIGTHALISEGVKYASLGMVVVDEQHRFGVEQRQRLKDKGFNPHLLVMTATPIPRTLTLTIYGDLDASVLDELPPGRQEIKTRWIASVERDKAYKHMRREISKGRQAYVICPLVEESEKVNLPSAEEMYAKLAGEIFPDLRVTLIHGKLHAREKDEVMVAFRNHEYDILVATAVIEVGIDVPNATTIVIEGADRFGLAQLHQFRGRVGRGVHQSFCILVSDRDNDVTKQRLTAMEETTDGFKLAEIDLQLRGPGEFFGTRQSGTPDLKVAQLADTRLLNAANREARKILNDDPNLDHPHHQLLKAKVDAFWADAMKAN
jgi:ATP-dependent DNA helicase RecG